MLDLGFFDPQEVKTPVFTSFCSFIIGITFYVMLMKNLNSDIDNYLTMFFDEFKFTKVT